MIFRKSEAPHLLGQRGMIKLFMDYHVKEVKVPMLNTEMLGKGTSKRDDGDENIKQT